VDEGAVQLGPLGEGRSVGAVNTITPAKRKEAAALVRTGRPVSLAHDLITLKDRDVALLGGDTAQDVGTVPGCSSQAPSPTMCWIPVHKFAIVARGMNLFDNLDLEAVASVAASLNRWEFLVMAAPVRVPKGTGSPINPIAVF